MRGTAGFSKAAANPSSLFLHCVSDLVAPARYLSHLGSNS